MNEEIGYSKESNTISVVSITSASSAGSGSIRRNVKPSIYAMGGLNSLGNSPLESKEEIVVSKRFKDSRLNDLKDIYEVLQRRSFGSPDVKDVATLLQACGYHPAKNEINDLIEEIDPKHQGTIDYPNFVKLFEMQLDRRDSIEEMTKGFSFFDKRKTGRISFEDLKLSAAELGEKLEDEEIQEMIYEGDSTNSGSVSLHDFIKLMSRAEKIE